MPPLLEVTALTKQFGSLPVVRDITFQLHPGEVVGLAGHSGAGKSVLTKMLAGLMAPSRGDLRFGGRKLHSSFVARRLGIEVIHQEPSLADNLDITANIFLGAELTTTWWDRLRGAPSQGRMDMEAARICAELDLAYGSLREKVGHLSIEQRQLVAIARTLAQPARLVIADDPASQLSYLHQQRLLTQIQRWQEQKVAVLFCSNNLEHLFAVTDRILTLRRGRLVADYRTDEVSREQIVAELVDATNREQLTPAIWALESYYQAREQAERLRYQQALLERDLEQQDTLNRQLVEQLAKQVGALDQANLALQDAQRRLLTEREQERKRLARELHDQVIQDMLSVNYDLEELTGAVGDQDGLGDELGQIRGEIRALVESVRRICGNLRPPTIDSLGLGAALQSFAREWGERTGVIINLELDANLGRLPEEIELSIFRIIQEGLSNVRKHAKATQVDVFLKHTSPRLLMISIADNGYGLDEQFTLSALSLQGHYGLLGISERVALLGGRLHIQNQKSGGVLLRVEIPHPRVGVREQQRT
ncbi:MAG: ATP-binding cassette domain-containing protein [Caldilineaceae bacterium]|nr:ATP-binding cassette domain-containing protein [Caldilineaceae bacterium]MBP8106951.1 ATP-binding cassette domain-containing protein [Caldilineaceae bacterium]MBP8121765.1 ATP-binding cassette domain-containing protein [Caldilineaceae bacterium]MBP9072383.1 ATP-binding cassette domain-containing protein [Caldilineaceae bacterium]